MSHSSVGLAAFASAGLFSYVRWEPPGLGKSPDLKGPRAPGSRKGTFVSKLGRPETTIVFGRLVQIFGGRKTVTAGPYTSGVSKPSGSSSRFRSWSSKASARLRRRWFEKKKKKKKHLQNTTQNPPPPHQARNPRHCQSRTPPTSPLPHPHPPPSPPPHTALHLRLYLLSFLLYGSRQSPPVPEPNSRMSKHLCISSDHVVADKSRVVQVESRLLPFYPSLLLFFLFLQHESIHEGVWRWHSPQPVASPFGESTSTKATTRFFPSQPMKSTR